MANKTHKFIVHVKEPDAGSTQLPVGPLPMTAPKLGGGGDPTGHAFIELQDDQGKSRIVGFYPGEALSANNALSTVKGALNDDAGHSVSTSLPYDITKEQYDKMMAEVDRWDSKTPNYSLLGNNCATFARSVAAAGGVSTPWQLSLVDSPSTLAPALRREQKFRSAFDSIKDSWARLKASFSSSCKAGSSTQKCSGIGEEHLDESATGRGLP